jgi:hypothetical protein
MDVSRNRRKERHKIKSSVVFTLLLLWAVQRAQINSFQIDQL